MNFITAFFVAKNLWSLRREIMYVGLTFLFVLLLPIIAVIIVTNTGIQVVSDKLVSINLKTHKVEIHDPSGKVITQINASTVWPVLGTVTLEFGESDLPYQPFHTGIDIASSNGKIGDPVTPFMKGTVTYVGDLSWGYGKHIIIDHGNNITSLYEHLSSINVKLGNKVEPGNVIGNEGNTGWSTGPHLHFEIRIFGIPVNPANFL
jgi:murein DD-endopeptidase MepM/ murein hydrolase activator NlpD